MPSPQQPSTREVLIESLGGLSEAEKEQLHGSNWAMFATRKVRSLRAARKWVWALSITMGLLALALPTTAFYHYYDATESFTILGFMGAVAAACLFAAAQMGWAVYVYMNWHHQLRCYESLRALGHEPDAEAAATAPAETT
jgi:cytochrome bd-type quinol oxidase subunit 2